MARIRTIHDHTRALARGLSGRQTVNITLIAVAVMAMADLGLTVQVAGTTGLLEVNPLARALAAGMGLAGIVVFKVLTVGLGLMILARARRSRLAPFAVAMALGVHVWMLTQWSGYFDAIAQVQASGHTELIDHQLAMRL